MISAEQVVMEPRRSPLWLTGALLLVFAALPTPTRACSFVKAICTGNHPFQGVNGYWNFARAVCVCSPSWTGRDCDVPVCAFSCNNGRCTAPNVCSCNAGWTGQTCSACESHYSFTSPHIHVLQTPVNPHVTMVSARDRISARAIPGGPGCLV